MSASDVVITGIGLVSSIGIGKDAHWQTLSQPGAKPVTDSRTYAPYTVHPLPEIDWSQQIPKRGDLRQMETWQRLGTFTAGLALDDAGIKGNEALSSTMDMIIAAGGGERDMEVDAKIIDGAQSRNDRDLLINEVLTTELRPTLFLAQLSNLLAGNISIVHKVTGSSRTFMGEEGAGISALDIAVKRIRSGRSSHVLVGASYQTEHPDMLLGFELGNHLHQGPWQPLWTRDGDGGDHVITGSGAAFLVLEAKPHAQSRGVNIYASIGGIQSSMVDRGTEDLSSAIGGLAKAAGFAGDSLVISGATGSTEPSGAEAKALSDSETAALRGFSGLTGHMKEVQFPFAVALAALSVANDIPYPPFDEDSEKPADGLGSGVLATSIGLCESEGMAMLYDAGASS